MDNAFKEKEIKKDMGNITIETISELAVSAIAIASAIILAVMLL
jgi:hypothetical protein